MALDDHILLTDTFGHWVDTTNWMLDKINAQLGDAVLATLLTTEKTTLVGAINELFTDKLDVAGGTITGDLFIGGNLTVNGDFIIGEDGGGNACLLFYDDTNDTLRSLCWDAGLEAWTAEDVNGDNQLVFHSGQDIDLGTFAGLTSDTQILFKGGTEAQNDAYTGGVNEITVDTENCALRLHDGVTPGGCTISGGGGAAGGNFTIEKFCAPGDFDQGVDTTLTLSGAPLTENNVFVFFDGVYQGKDTFIVTGTTLDFQGVPIEADCVDVAYGEPTGVTGNPLQNRTTELFIESTDYTGGVDDTFTLMNDPGVKANVDILFDAVPQPKSEFSVSGLDVILNSPVPSGVSQVEITYGHILPLGEVPDDSVGTDQLAHGTPNFLLGFDGSGIPTEIDPNSLPFPEFDIDALPTVLTANTPDLLALSVGGTESAITAQNFANAIQSLSSGSFGLKGIQSFTSSGTYTPTAGTKAIMVICTGGGGGSAGPGQGGTSSFGAFCSATGGERGETTGTGEGGSGSGGIINLDGSPGRDEDFVGDNGAGGTSFWGGPVNGLATPAERIPGAGLNAGGVRGTGAGGTAIDFITSGFSSVSVTIGLGGSQGSGANQGQNGIVVVFEFG